jgi:hypothetical protein
MEISTFVNKLVNCLKEEKTFELILRDVEGNKTTWDEVARNRISSIVKSVFQDSFPEENIKEAVNIEGEGALIKPYKLFGSLGQWPDIRILKPKQIAIELDHAKKGKPGSRFKMALAKAAFGYLSGDYNYCIVLFHNRTGKSMSSHLKQEKEHRILNFYLENFHTQIFLFE